MTKTDHRLFLLFVILLIFIFGVQIGIRHGRELERSDQRFHARWSAR